MPTKKQLSFIDGELSPALRFKTDLASYATGLSKLYNMLVEKAGGSSNRAGFFHMWEVPFQSALKVKGRYKIFSALVPHLDDETNISAVIFMVPSGIGEQVQIINDTQGVLSNIIDNSIAVNAVAYDLNKVTMAQYGPVVYFSDGTRMWAYRREDVGGTDSMEDYSPTTKNSIVAAGASVSTTFVYVTTILDRKPVQYKVYQVFKTGEEIFYLRHQDLKVGTYSPQDPIQPTTTSGANSMNEMQFPLSADVSVKHYNIYRASRDGAISATAVEDGNWGLVGRMSRPTVDGVYKFSDYITTPDFTKKPPEDRYLFGNVGTSLSPMWDKQSMRRVGFYQQRSVIVVNPAYSDLDEGSVIVSQIGNPEYLFTHAVFTDIGAFDFKAPIGVQGRVIATMGAKRLVLFTEDAVVVVHGGERGVLTPTAVNPEVVSRVGCSDSAAPISVGDKGFFLSKTGEKIMMIQFGLEETVAVSDITELSSHLLKGKKIIQMAYTRGLEDRLWALRNDGTLISSVVREEGVGFGFSVMDTDGFVESIAASSWTGLDFVNVEDSDDARESLAISVVREGVRHLERLAYREDVVPELKNFVDSSSDFGRVLVLDEENVRYKYRDRLGVGVQPRLNITGGTLWDETETLTITELGGLAVFTLTNQVLFFYYTVGGVERAVRFDQTGTTSTSIITGRFTSLVPAELRDAQTLAADDMEKRLSRWLPAFKSFSSIASGALSVGITITRFNGRDVSVFADDMVYSSPNNPNQPTLSVAAGVLTLPSEVANGFVGLPYESDLETLNLDTSDERTFTDAKKLINEVGIAFYETKGGFVGQTESGNTLPISVDEMEEIISRSDETFEEVTKNINEHISQDIPAHWEPTGRVLIKQVDPSPITVLAVYPKGVVGK